MRNLTWLVVVTLSLEACGPRGGTENNPGAKHDDRPSGSPHWALQANGDGVALALLEESGATALRLFCPAGENRMLVNVPAFAPIGSEERLSFGSGGNVVALVADPRGDAESGGVSGSGPVPDDLKGLVAGQIGASYGAQRSGPHAPPPPDLARRFVTTCFGYASASLQAASKPGPATSPCLVQDGDLLRMAALKGVGTEPFWGARIEGRCITYSTPEDPKGTRVWARFNSGPQGGVWTGNLDGKPFVLSTTPVANCSDGMSDNRYQIAVSLTVRGEVRRGCAAPLAK